MAVADRVESGTRIIAEPGRPEMSVTREFNAPREFVFQAHTDPKLFAQWIGPRYLTTEIQTFEPRHGGRWRYIQRGLDGNEYAFHGVFHEVLAPERIIQTFEFEGLPEAGHAILDTARFEALSDNRTRLTTHSAFQSVEDRDGMMQDGMEAGMEDSYARLDELLARMCVGR